MRTAIPMLARSLRTARRYLLDRMVLRPSRGFVDQGTQQRVFLNVHGRRLESFVHRVGNDEESSHLLVLKFPGTAGRAERSSPFPLPMLVDVAGQVWTWNPPGYGGSQGRASLRGMADAAIGFAEQVLQHDDVHANTVWLCGNSLGCNSALHVAAHCAALRSFRVGLLLRNPPPLIPVVKRIAARYPMGKHAGSIAESVCPEMNAMLTAPKISFPAVFLQSSQDDLVPPSMQNDLIETYAGNSRLVELVGLAHDGVATDQQAILIAEQILWLWNQTQTSR